MLLEGCKGCGVDSFLAVNGLAERFGAFGAENAGKPRARERFIEQGELVGGDGGFFFFSSGVTYADKKTSKQ